MKIGILGIALLLISSSSVMAHDVDGDGRDGLPEAINSLKTVAGFNSVPYTSALDFEVITPSENFTTSSQGWILVSIDSFLTSTGFVLSFMQGINVDSPPWQVYDESLYYELSDCEGAAYSQDLNPEFYIFRVGNLLYYKKYSDVPQAITSLSWKGGWDSECRNMESNVLEDMKPAYLNDPAITGVDIQSPSNVTLLPVNYPFK